MSVPGQSGIASFALQPGCYGDDTALPVSALQWYRTRAPRIGLSAQQQQENFPPETGGPIIPTGAFKSGAFVAGDIELIARAQEFLGFILYAALGAVTTTTGSRYSSQTNGYIAHTGVNAHKFNFNPTSSYALPWLAARTVTPAELAAKDFGQVYQDLLIAGVSLTVPAAGLLALSVDFQGRKPTFPASVSGWTYANTVEDAISAVHSGRSKFLIGGEKYPITQASIQLANNLSSPQQEQVIGSFYPGSFTALNRQLSIKVVMKWKDADFYKKVLMNSLTETDWQSIPFILDTVGSNKAFEAEFLSPGNIPGSNPALPFMLKIVANRVTWQLDRGGVELRAGDLIMVSYIGTVLEPASGQDYVEFYVHNAATYTLPAVGSTPPFIALSFPTIPYTGTDIVLDPGVVIDDYDSLNFNGGSFSLTLGGAGFSSGQDDVELDGVNAIVTGGNAVSEGVIIGTSAFVAGDTSITIALTALSTPALLKSFVRGLKYGTVGNASRALAVVNATYALTDGDGGTADAKVLQIVHA